MHPPEPRPFRAESISDDFLSTQATVAMGKSRGETFVGRCCWGDVMQEENKRPSVLYAEDEEAISETLSEILQDSGFSVCHAIDGLHALEMAAQMHFDVLLTDMDMPRMGGLELVRLLRTARPRLPVVVLTGNPPLDGSALFQADWPGKTILLSKPARLRQIIDSMKTVLAEEPSTTESPSRPAIEAEHNSPRKILWNISLGEFLSGHGRVFC